MTTERLRGQVTLVGAGPGDPDLLTVRAVRRLADADLVLYDALSSPQARSLAPEARWFFVGKRAGRHSMSQATINRLMIREAQRGRHVVRLKSGDPFVLGRGGEEAEALLEAGIPFEVVPGVTSAIAAPALAGIPVTHRGLSTGFVVISGHAPSSYGPLFDSLAPGAVTVVVLMGLGERGAIADRLIARGWQPSTPVAVLLGAATDAAWRWIGTLAELGEVTFPAPEAPNPGYGLMPRSPGILVIGDVVNLAARLDCADALATNHAG
ncbi:MAG: uroporphyrinogen-III C-methyltransferase [Deltaproteobacteria bacterium]|nr:uroporphyrinogen-III C-methyltransferase [Deltaproteobacteria bacterium]